MYQIDQMRYWETVKQCLMQLHKFRATYANKQVNAYRAQIEKDQLNSAIYHDEPYEISCNIAHTDPQYEAHWERYKTIRAQHLSKQVVTRFDLDKPRSKSPKISESRGSFTIKKVKTPITVVDDSARSVAVKPLATSAKSPKVRSTRKGPTSKNTSTKRTGAKKAAEKTESKRPSGRRVAGKSTK